MSDLHFVAPMLLIVRSCVTVGQQMFLPIFVFFNPKYALAPAL